MKIGLLSSICFGACIALASFAHGDTFDTAVQAVTSEPASDFFGGPVATVTYKEATFHLHPVEPGHREKGRVAFSGKIDVKGDKVHQLAYRIVREKGAMKIELKMDDAPWQPLSQEMEAASTKLRAGGPMSSDERAALLKSLSGALDGTWLRYAELLIMHISVRYC